MRPSRSTPVLKFAFSLFLLCSRRGGGYRYESWRPESFIERKKEVKPQETGRSYPLLPPTPVGPHSAEVASGWMAAMLLKGSGAARSQLWGERALPLAGCHVAPVT